MGAAHDLQSPRILRWSGLQVEGAGRGSKPLVKITAVILLLPLWRGDLLLIGTYLCLDNFHGALLNGLGFFLLPVDRALLDNHRLLLGLRTAANKLLRFHHLLAIGC